MIWRLLLVLGLTVPLSSCSILVGEDGVFRDRKKDYKKAESVERIQVPAHLDDTALIDYYAIPEPGPRAGRDMIDSIPLPTGIQTERQDHVRLQTLGERQWVLVQMPPSQVWPRLRTFINNQPMQLLAESGSVGIVETAVQGGFFHFRVEQGLQRNTTELSALFTTERQDRQGIWPQVSGDVQKEHDVLMQIAQFLADLSEQRIYSFAAQGISTEPRLLEREDDDGLKFLLLRADTKRATASLQSALSRTGFVELESDAEAGVLFVQYAPPWPEDKEPGFFRKLLRIRASSYDSTATYAGHYYRFDISEQSGLQKVAVQAVDASGQQEDREQQELNAQLMRVKGALY